MEEKSEKKEFTMKPRLVMKQIKPKLRFTFQRVAGTFAT